MTDVRWGILGTARIATKVAAAIHQAQGAMLKAIASRSADRAQAWQAEHKAERTYDSYRALLEDPEIDAVYIPLPPALHAEWTIKAAEHGKHVLCEKPVAMSVLEAREMVDACAKHSVQFMDGVMWYHHPRCKQMQDIIKQGQLGQLRRMTSAFTFHWDQIPINEFRLQKKLGGGSLFDLGWYCVGASLWAFGLMPTAVGATAKYHNNVDMTFTGWLWFPDDCFASFDCGFQTSMRKWFEVAGVNKSLICDDFTRPWHEERPRCWLHDANGKAAEIVSEPVVQEVCMIEAFVRIVQSGKRNTHWPNMSLRTQQVCDALLEAARTQFPVEIF